MKKLPADLYSKKNLAIIRYKVSRYSRTIDDIDGFYGEMVMEYHKAAERWNGEGSITGWCMWIIEKRMVDYLRENGPQTRAGVRRLNIISIDEIIENWHEHPELGDGFERRYNWFYNETISFSQFMESVLKEMPEVDQYFYKVKWVGQHTDREIMRHMGVKGCFVSMYNTQKRSLERFKKMIEYKLKLQKREKCKKPVFKLHKNSRFEYNFKMPEGTVERYKKKNKHQNK